MRDDSMLRLAPLFLPVYKLQDDFSPSSALFSPCSSLSHTSFLLTSPPPAWFIPSDSKAENDEMKAISKDSFPALLTHSASQPEGHVTPPIRRARSSYPFFNIAFLQLDFLFLFILWNNHHFLFAATPVRTRPTELIFRKLYIFQL